MEGPIDFNGSGTITGGTLIVATAGGGGWNTAMLSGLRTVTVPASGQAGETVTLADANGAVIGTFTPENAFGTLMISSAALADGGEFTVLSGSRTLYSGAGTDTVSSATSNTPGGQGQGRDGFGGGMGHGRRGH